jgi:primosomal protein N' (replication factor Y)
VYIQVQLLGGLTTPLTYKIPDDWDHTDLVGKLVRVPVRTQKRTALVLSLYTEAELRNAHSFAHQKSFVIKEALELEPFPADPHYHPFVTQLSQYYQTDQMHFIRRIQHFLRQKEMRPEDLDPLHPAEEKPRTAKNSLNLIETLENNAHESENSAPITLTPEQQDIVDTLRPHIDAHHYIPSLLHGVTGSGKTEIYKQLLMHTVTQGKSAILLVPEVTLALQFERLLKTQLPSTITLYGFHSATSVKTKKQVWQALLKQEPCVIIGVHVPILLPHPNLGLIIVDEEHEAGYQEKKHPKVNSKEAALLRARMDTIPIVLGSATPSLSSLYNVEHRGWQFFQLKKRFAGAFPAIKTVSLLEKKQRRRSFWISKELETAIAENLSRKEQTIIFLNRRGFSFFVQCKACSFIISCANCSVSLTLHSNNTLTCHYCGYTVPMPNTCPSCKAPDDQLLKKGIGTQQIVSILEKLFPDARIGRADLDVTSKKKVWQETITAFEQQKLDILVGTQTITKGFHFPQVSLVGIIWADLNLHFPVYNAAETTLQQLIQVAGRAGRQKLESTIIVQTMIEHPIFNFINEVDYLDFYAHELGARKDLGYPPYARLIEIELKHVRESVVERDAHMLVERLMTAQETAGCKIQILGPAKPPVYKIKHTYARKIYLKGTSINDLISLFQATQPYTLTSSVFFTPNPTS